MADLESVELERAIHKKSPSRRIYKLPSVEDIVKRDVPSNRMEEIERYLKLFGYKPERTILQIHLAGSFGSKKYIPKNIERQEAARKKYGGTTFTLLGRTHDPAIEKYAIHPKRINPEYNEGYLGYLFMKKDADFKAPHELLPLDFIPMGLNYPTEWRVLFNTKGYFISMHVPSSFVLGKNEVHMQLRRMKGGIDPKKKWDFLDSLEKFGYFKEK
jgi:hypothetical protein